MRIQYHNRLIDGGENMKNNKTVKKINKKLHKASKIINLAATALVLAMTVYTLIPKDEKISGIDENKLAERFMPKQDA